MAVLDGQLLQGGYLTLLDGSPHEAENAVGHCRDTKLIIAPNVLGQKSLVLLQKRLKV